MQKREVLSHSNPHNMQKHDPSRRQDSKTSILTPPKIVPKVPLYTKRAKVAVQALKSGVLLVFLAASPKLDFLSKKAGRIWTRDT